MSRYNVIVYEFLRYLHNHPINEWPQEISYKGEVFDLYKSHRTTTYLSNDLLLWTYAIGDKAEVLDLNNWLRQQSIIYEVDDEDKKAEWGPN